MKLADEIKNIDDSPKKLREFGLFVGGILAVLGGFLLWKERPSAPYFLLTGSALFVGGALIPAVLKPLFKVWIGFALVMGFVMSYVLLSILFFLILTPISFIAKFRRNVLLDLSFPDDKKSFWTLRETKQNMDSYEKQY